MKLPVPADVGRLRGLVFNTFPSIDRFVGKHRFLSNFYPHPLRVDGIDYPSSEQAYQAAKTRVIAEKRAIAACATPAKAKRAARKLTLRDDWRAVRVAVMTEILRLKFRDPKLAARLRATGSAQLIEGNTRGDRYWGVCDGVGENWLGRILMRLRDELNRKAADPFSAKRAGSCATRQAVALPV